MSFISEYPEHRYLLPKATVQREVLLPEDVSGAVLVRKGQRVDPRMVIARGQGTSRHHIVEAAQALGLRVPDDLTAKLLVEVNEAVEEGQALAGDNANRGRRAFSPVEGVVAAVSAGRIIVKETPPIIELEAGIQGYVVELRGNRGAVIETNGAVIQGVWGNNRRAVGVLRWEPKEGIEFIKGDDINTEWRGTIIITKSPLSYQGMVIMEEQEVAGVVAPSMDSTLLDAAAAFKRAILITNSFGNQRMALAVQTLLTDVMKDNPNVQGALDAVQPGALEARRPELVITLTSKDAREFPVPRLAERLQLGMTVRIAREPYLGQTGRVTALPLGLAMLPNGLRVPVATVELPGGEREAIPIADLEVLGV